MINLRESVLSTLSEVFPPEQAGQQSRDTVRVLEDQVRKLQDALIVRETPARGTLKTRESWCFHRDENWKGYTDSSLRANMVMRHIEGEGKQQYRYETLQVTMEEEKVLDTKSEADRHS